MAESFETKPSSGRKPRNGDARKPRRRNDRPGTFSDELQFALMRFKEGDFASRMPASFVGMEGKLADLLKAAK